MEKTVFSTKIDLLYLSLYIISLTMPSDSGTFVNIGGKLLPREFARQYLREKAKIMTSQK